MNCHQSATNIWGCSIPAQANFSTARLETLRPASTTSYISSPFAVHVSDHLSDLHEPHAVTERNRPAFLHELKQGVYPRSCTLRILEYYTSVRRRHFSLTYSSRVPASFTKDHYIPLTLERFLQVSRQISPWICTCQLRFHRSMNQTEMSNSWNDQARHVPRCSKK